MSHSDSPERDHIDQAGDDGSRDDESPRDDEQRDDDLRAEDGLDDEASDRLVPSDPFGGLLDELDIDAVDVKDLLRNALGEPKDSQPSRAVIEGVRRRLREESSGRFYGDGWSNSSTPKATFLVTSLVMLLVVLLAGLLLSPYGLP